MTLSDISPKHLGKKQDRGRASRKQAGDGRNQGEPGCLYTEFVLHAVLIDLRQQSRQGSKKQNASSRRFLTLPGIALFCHFEAFLP